MQYTGKNKTLLHFEAQGDGYETNLTNTQKEKLLDIVNKYKFIDYGFFTSKIIWKEKLF